MMSHQPNPKGCLMAHSTTYLTPYVHCQKPTTSIGRSPMTIPADRSGIFVKARVMSPFVKCASHSLMSSVTFSATWVLNSTCDVSRSAA